MSKKHTIVRMSDDGALQELETSGKQGGADSSSNDRESPPITPKNIGGLRTVPRIKTLRRALQLTQKEFAERYHIPLGTLIDWEQGRKKPDKPASAYIRVIANDPERTRRALSSQNL